MLDEDCDIGKLEGSVEECGVQGFAEWEVCGFHGVYSIADLSGSGDDVRDVDDSRPGNNEGDSTDATFRPDPFRIPKRRK